MAKYEHADDRGQAAAASATRDELKALLRAVLERSSDMEGPDRSASDRARALYLRGRLVECTADHGDADDAKSLLGAEEALKKAAKLNPTLEGAWICLGQLLWRKGNLDGARNCYTAVTARAPNKKASQCMSMLYRTIAKAKAAPGTDEQKTHVLESLKHAKAAIKMDLTDGHSWYQCGMAYMTQFFAEGATDPAKLTQSLQCFSNAEKGGPAGDGSLTKGGVGDYPDLHFNRATVRRYVEDYGPALEGFKRAAALDPQLPWRGEVDALLPAPFWSGSSTNPAPSPIASMKPAYSTDACWGLSRWPAGQRSSTTERLRSNAASSAIRADGARPWLGSLVHAAVPCCAASRRSSSEAATSGAK